MTHDDEPFVTEVMPHLVALRAAARRLGADHEDLLQETYLRALAARHTYRPGSNARGWLYRILVNVSMSEHRRRARERRLEARLSHEPRPRAASPERAPDVEALHAALATLGPHDREVIELADLEGLRYREIARTLGCPVGTVMSRLHRARRRLRGRLTA